MLPSRDVVVRCYRDSNIPPARAQYNIPILLRQLATSVTTTGAFYRNQSILVSICSLQSAQSVAGGEFNSPTELSSDPKWQTDSCYILISQQLARILTSQQWQPLTLPASRGQLFQTFPDFPLSESIGGARFARDCWMYFLWRVAKCDRRTDQSQSQFVSGSVIVPGGGKLLGGRPACLSHNFYGEAISHHNQNQTSK